MKTKTIGMREIKVPTKAEPLTVVIKRRQWFRGRGPENSRLRTLDGKMCCLGFDAKALGFKNEDIDMKTTPDSVNGYVPGLARSGHNTRICASMMDVNDDDMLTDNQREAKLIKLAKRIGRVFVFKN